jgi:hypothetical protein
MMSIIQLSDELPEWEAIIDKPETTPIPKRLSKCFDGRKC